MTIFYPPTDDGIETTAPFRRRVGHEVEIDDRLDFQQYLWDSGYGTPPIEDYYERLAPHPKGCRCDDSRTHLIHVTVDSSSPGNEHLIGGPDGVLFGSPTYMAATAAIAETAKATGSGGTERTGGHIHVSRQDMTNGQVFRTLRNAGRLWPQITALAAGRWDEVRNNCHTSVRSFSVASLTPQIRTYRSGGYNGGYGYENVDAETVNPDDVEHFTRYFQGNPFLIDRDDKPTIEWRMWNTMTSQWRLYLTAGVAAAMHEAGKEGRDATYGMDLLTHLDGILPPDIVALVERQRAIQARDFSWAA